jgi:hypothetical protein
MEHNPILNSPYLEPNLHYATVATGEEKGSLDYTWIVEGRRISGKSGTSLEIKFKI